MCKQMINSNLCLVEILENCVQKKWAQARLNMWLIKCVYKSYSIYMYEKDSISNNPQNPNKLNQTNHIRW